MWAQAFGLIATPLENELGFPSGFPIVSLHLGENMSDDRAEAQLGNIFSAFSAGLTAGVNRC